MWKKNAYAPAMIQGSSTNVRILLEGNVKKRGQVNAAYKGRFFVLKDDVLEYYEDKKVRRA